MSSNASAASGAHRAGPITEPNTSHGPNSTRLPGPPTTDAQTRNTGKQSPSDPRANKPPGARDAGTRSPSDPRANKRPGACDAGIQSPSDPRANNGEDTRPQSTTINVAQTATAQSTQRRLQTQISKAHQERGQTQPKEASQTDKQAPSTHSFLWWLDSF